MEDLAHSHLAALMKPKMAKDSRIHTSSCPIYYNTVLGPKHPKVKGLSRRPQKERYATLIYTNDESIIYK